MTNIRKYLLLLVMEEILSVAKKLLLLLMLLSVLIYAGCGSGGGGSSTPSTTTGTIQGTVSISSDSASSSSFNISSLNSSINFPKVPLRKSQFTQQSVSNEKIVKLRPGLNDSEAAQIIAGLGGTIKKKLYGTESTFLITVNDQTFSKSSANQNSNIVYMGDNLIFQAFAVPNDEFYPLWNYNMVNLPAAWDEQKGNSTVIVAVIDTGVSLNHPDLSTNLVQGYDFVDGDSDPSDTGGDEASHGTHVAGTISAVTNNGIGIAGVAWNVKIMPIRALGPGGRGDGASLLEGINWAVNHGANVINLSLGTHEIDVNSDEAAIYKEAIYNAIAKGVTVVAAAGNEFPDMPNVCFPANYGPVIAVGALNKDSTIASYSCRGPELDLFAPGGDKPLTPESLILSTCYNGKTRTNTYAYMAGTSMACPHVAGVAALLYSRGFTSPSDIEKQLKDTAYKLSDDPPYHGAGLIDAYAALNGAKYGPAAAKVYCHNVDTGTDSVLYDVRINGNYTIPNVKPGKYIIYAFIDKDKSGNINNGDLAGISDTITVIAGSTTTVNFVLEEYTSASSITIKEHFQSLLSAKQ